MGNLWICYNVTQTVNVLVIYLPYNVIFFNCFLLLTHSQLFFQITYQAKLGLTQLWCRLLECRPPKSDHSFSFLKPLMINNTYVRGWTSCHFPTVCMNAYHLVLAQVVLIQAITATVRQWVLQLPKGTALHWFLPHCLLIIVLPRSSKMVSGTWVFHDIDIPLLGKHHTNTCSLDFYYLKIALLYD